MKLKNWVSAALVLAAAIFICATGPVLTAADGADERLTNPIVQALDTGAADPWVTYKDGFYYYCRSLSDQSVGVAKAKRLQDIGTAEMVTVFTPDDPDYDSEIWAPELHYLLGKWYIYYAADNGDNANHRMCVAESDTQDPQGSYTYKGVLRANPDRWAIDGTVLETDGGELYYIWSGWAAAVNNSQEIYIAPMTNPWTISTGTERAMLSRPELPWETVGTPAVNEAPQVLKKDGKIFIVYSASGSWTNEYCLGLLTLTGTDVMNPGHWQKSEEPVFKMAHSAYSTGHASFVPSPDGTEDWMVYHAYQRYNGGWGNRSTRAQQFTWHADGTPNFPEPVAYGTAVAAPSGTPEGLGMAAFEDHFAAEGLTQDDWQVYGGDWRIDNESAAATVSGGNPGGKIVSKSADFIDFEYTADITLTQSNGNENAGVLFRVNKPAVGADALYGYYAGISCENGGWVQIGRMDNNWNELITVPTPVLLNTTYELKVVAQGKSIRIYLDGKQIIDVVDDTYVRGSVGVRAYNAGATAANLSVRAIAGYENPTYDWSFAKGAVFVPTNAVNQIDHWMNYDPAINERELAYASIYGINLVRVYLHNLLWENDSEGLLANMEHFLSTAEKCGIRTEFVLFDDCWNDNPQYGDQGTPDWGVHNSRWVEAPGDAYKDRYNDNGGDNGYRRNLEAYVKGVVSAFTDDDRIALWNTFNEPGNGENAARANVTKQIMNDSRIWIAETGSTIPISATAGQFSGRYFSDFITWHPYDASYPIDSIAGIGSDQLIDETMNRGLSDNNMTMTGIMNNYYAKGMGFAVWEFGIGRDNTRFAWDHTPQEEPAVPFHGLVYPDGHPWSLDDIGALSGGAESLPVYTAEYYNGDFETLMKTSVTPFIDFDLGGERGTASPDASAGVNEKDFAIRYSGAVTPETSGTYTFYIASDNRVAVTFNGEPLLEKTTAGYGEVAAEIELAAGENYPVVVTYYNADSNAQLHFHWSAEGLAKKAVPAAMKDLSAERVTVSPTLTTLELYGSVVLKATVSPFGGAVTWSSSDDAVAAVGADGTVRAVAEGMARIRARAVNGVSAEAVVVVKRAQSPVGDLSGYNADHFEGAVLDGAWAVEKEDGNRWSMTAGGDSALRIVGGTGDMHQTGNSHRNVFLRRDIAGGGDFSVMTKVTLDVTGNYMQAGLVVWQDQDNYVRFGHVYNSNNGGKGLELGLETAASYSNVAQLNKDRYPAFESGSNTVYLRLTKQGNVYTPEVYNEALGGWIVAATPVTAGFSDIQVGLYALGMGDDTTVACDFDYIAWQTPEGAAVPSVPGTVVHVVAPEGGDVAPVVSVTDDGAALGAVQVIVAAYDADGRLADVQIEAADIAAGETVTLQPVAARNDALSYRCMVWDGGGAPLIDVIVLD